MRNGFFKGHGLGNDYLVVDPADLDFRVTPATVRRLCDRHTGMGADGLMALAPPRGADFGVRIYNPDGSEAEKSGNGLRIFARYLEERSRTRRRRLRVWTRGGVVGVEMHRGASGESRRVSVSMGRASFRPRDLPCTLPGPELVDRAIRVRGRTLRFTGVSVGNPHCVVFSEGRRRWTRDDLLDLGPALESHRVFPRRCNVQLAERTGPRALSIRIFERGAGETRASGSSASAVAAAAVRLGLVRSPIRVRAPGGDLSVTVTSDFDVVLSGAVSAVASGRLSSEFVRSLGASRPRASA